MYGHNVTGAMDVKWKNYDWSTDRNSPDFINKPKNNMADTRSDVCSMGDDGMLYAAFEAAGGNHIFRYDAKNISNGVGDKLKKGDWYHDFYRSASDHKTVFGRYNPGTGDVIYIKQFCCRLLSDESRGKTNTATPSAIAADKDGKVYVGGGSAFGLPIPNSRVNATGKTTKYSQVSYKNVASGWNPGDDEDWDYTGGGWLLIISSDFTERLHCSRVAMSARVNTIAARARDGLVPVVVFGGFKSNKNSTIYLENEFQSELSSNEDETKTGWFTIYNTTNNIDVRRQMVAKLPHLSRVSLSNGGIKVEKEGVNRIAIYAISGALVKNYKVSVGETIVPELSTGTYMVQVHSKNSVQSLRYSVIK